MAVIELVEADEVTMKPASKAAAVLKKPSSDLIAVYKYKYKNGTWGFKIDKKEVFRAFYLH
jgi:hypothetical protein